MHSIHKAFYNSLYNISSFETRDIYIECKIKRLFKAIDTKIFLEYFDQRIYIYIYNSITMIKNLIIIFESK